ncbi:MAG TPA: DNA mismatch repair endonuclease MutL [Candidatus Latescibacteria bacterium]|nr:DNA mismatch repair endonuclease MutL [Candidatus Latescibacterota bacterium]
MATRIRILPDEAINKIAAGEVVERPASIVKELVENAVDANPNRITIEVWAGGRDRIRVTDTGCGMSQDDAMLSLERHATSKIRTADDLADLKTLGFRGEAIPSIAAVSHMTIETRDHPSSVGTRINVEGGQIRQVSEIGRDLGTSVSVDQVFYNTPARRKFLKGAQTEWRHISQTVTGVALANPGISFSLRHDGREILKIARGSIEERIEALFRVRIGEDAVLVDREIAGIAVRGYVDTPENTKKTANQVIIVNGRWVRHRGIAQAVTDGYGGLLKKDVLPAFALCIDVDPKAVDINVHPSKREVKFADGRRIYRAVADAVRADVREEGGIPDWSVLESTSVVIDSGVGYDDESVSRSTAYPMPLSADGMASESPASLREPLSFDDSQIALPLSLQGDVETPADVASEAKGEDAEIGRHRFFQIHGRYFLAQVKQGLLIVDQNLAHERVVYEDTVRSMSEGAESSGQALLFPVTLEFGLTEIVTVREVMPLLEKVGFGIRDFGGNTVVVDAVPSGLETSREGELLRGIVDDFLSDRTAHLDLGDRAIDPTIHFLALAYARRVAIPHGKVMLQREMENLIDTLFACSEPYKSPSGRPTLSRLSLEDIGRRFEP